MTNQLATQNARSKSCDRTQTLFGVARASISRPISIAMLLFSVSSMVVLVGAQTKQTRQISVIQDMATLENIPAPQLAFVGKEDYELNGAKGTRYKLSVTNRASHPDFLWWPSSHLPPCGNNKNSARTWVEIFGSPGDRRLTGFCTLRASEDLGHLWFAQSSGESAPACVYLVMTDRQTEKKYSSNRVCSRRFAMATGSLKGTAQPGAQGSKGHEGSKGWIEIGSVQFNEDKPATQLRKAGGSSSPSKEREAGVKEMQAEKEKEPSLGNQAVSGRVTGVVVDPSAPMRAVNKLARPAQPDLMIKQFLFPPTNDKALRVQVVNQGNAASGACRLILTVRKINGIPVGRKTHVNIPALAANKTVWLVIDAKSILPVSVSLESTTFKLNADGTGIVVESDETNNEVWHNL